MQLSAEQAAATAIDDNLVVNAGAGSGKTTVLTTRYIRLLVEGGLEPSQIVAITFTKKAAREMRERIDKMLAQRAASDPRWLMYRDQLISAPISTIHSFYARILRAYPVEAGVAPSFQVLNELDADLMLAQALAKLRESIEVDPNLARLTQIYGAKALEEDGLVNQLKTVYTTLLNRGIPIESAGLSDLYQELPDWQVLRDKFLELIAGEEELTSELSSKGKDKPEMALDRKALVAIGVKLALIEAPDQLAGIYSELLPLTGLKAGRTGGHREFMKTGVELLQLLLSSGLAPVLGAATLALIRDLDRYYRGIKNRSEGLDYTDLQFAVWNLLHMNPSIVQRLRDRYRTYMIDEFQDTDRLQHQIINLLVEEEGEIPPGRLFVVGDEKQSIYRFRGAEVKVFDEVRKKLTKGNPLREKKITCNYRSRRPLIDLVNSLFSRLMGSTGESEISYIDLTAHRQGQGPCAEIIQCAPIRDDESSSEAEARVLAARIQAMVGDLEIVADSQDAPRPIRYGDITILVRSRTHLREYEYNLRVAGIPYTVIGGIGFYQQQEVVDIVNLLKVVSNLNDELALAAVLRSPLFALDDDSLLILCSARRQGGNLLEYAMHLEGACRCKLERAREVIFHLRQARGRLEIPRLIELALELTHFREVTLTRFGGMQRYANLEKLVEMAAGYSRASIGNLSSFLSWLEHAAEKDEAEAQIDNEDTDSVKIMTIHASKGLEFPVVFLPVCSSKLRHFPGRLLLDDGGNLVFRHNWDCSVWEMAKEQEKKREQEEFKRLLYVAITRARDWLTVLAQEPGNNEVSFNIWLQEFAQTSTDFATSAMPQGSELSINLPTPLPKPGPAPDLQPELLQKMQPVGHGKRTFRYYSISQFMLWRQNREEFDKKYLSRWVDCDPLGPRAEQVGDWQHEPGGATFGSLLHAALEQIDAQTDITQLLLNLIPRFFGDADQAVRDKVLYSARTLLKRGQMEPGPPGKFHHLLNELEFYYRLQDSLFYGLIDRLLISEDHVAIVDFKTNHIPNEGIEPLVEIYTPQIMFYALAAEEIYKLPARGYLQLLRRRPGEQIIEIDMSPQKVSELKLQLQEFIRYCN